MPHYRSTIGETKACNKERVEITSKDLPLSCPSRDDRVWDAHPKVFLPLEETGEYLCPYCGTQYVLRNFISPKE